MPKLKRMFSYVREGFLMLFFVPAGAFFADIFQKNTEISGLLPSAETTRVTTATAFMNIFARCIPRSMRTM